MQGNGFEQFWMSGGRNGVSSRFSRVCRGGRQAGLMESETNGLMLQVCAVQRALAIPQLTDQQLRVPDMNELRQLWWSVRQASLCNEVFFPASNK